MNRVFSVIALALLFLSASAHGGVIEFTDKDEWINAVGEFTTVDFTGFPEGTFITDQYADLGVLFTDGDDNIRFSPTGFPNDEWGLDGNTAIHLSFDSPQAYISADYPGGMKIELFSEGRLIYTSSNFGVGGAGNFAGLLSTDLFDGALLYDWIPGDVFIDDLHFGPPACPWDLDGNGSVGASDLLSLLASWGPCPPKADCPADFDDNGTVGASDLLALLANWGPCP